jgi:hypothetical protein
VTLASLATLLRRVADAAAATAAGGAEAAAEAAPAAPLSDAALKRRAARCAAEEANAVGAARLEIDRAFSSVSILNASFCSARYSDAAAPLSRSRLVLADVHAAYAAIMDAGERHPKVLTTLKAALCRAAADMERLSSARRLQRGGLASGAASQERPESLHAVVIVLLNPLLRDGRLGSASSTIARNTISAFLRLPAGARALFKEWWGELPAASFNAVVGALVAFVNFSQSTGAVADIWGAATVLKELWVVHQTVRLDAADAAGATGASGAAGAAGAAAGEKRKREGGADAAGRNDVVAGPIATVCFVCDGLRLTGDDLKQDYRTWMTQRATVHSFSAFAFLLNADIKRRLFRIEATSRMIVSQQRSVADFFSAVAAATLPAADRGGGGGAPPATPTPVAADFVLRMTVRREFLLRDALDLLEPIYVARARRDELLRPLVVKFQGELGEDLGGVTKEFFTLLLRALTRGESGDAEVRRRGGAPTLRGRGGAGAAPPSPPSAAAAAAPHPSPPVEPAVPVFESTPGGFLWWNTATKAELEWTGARLRQHELVGLLFSLAVYNGALLGVAAPFSRYFLQQMVPTGGGGGTLAATPPSLAELRRMKPAVAAGLDELLAYDEDARGISVEDAFQVRSYIKFSVVYFFISFVCSLLTMSFSW